MKYSDAGRLTSDQFALLQKLAPGPEKGPGSGVDPATKSAPGRSPRSDFGRLSIESYLRHFGVEYNVKDKPGKTLYRLSQCLFDPSHTKNEAAIVQSDRGLVTYSCFHNSCNGKTWPDARKQISGKESLARFCEGYDPNKPAPGSAGRRGSSPFDIGKGEFCDLPEVPSPVKIPISWFQRKTKHGFKFVPVFLAKYLELHTDPIVYDGGDFYAYTDAGVWKTMAWDVLAQISECALGAEAKSAHIKDAISLLSNRVYRTPEELKHDPNWVNTTTGMLNVDTLAIVKHHKKYMSRIQLAAGFDPAAKCDRWLRYLEEVWPEEPEKAETLQRYYGYCLLPDCRFQRCLFMIGSGANGKSVAVDVLVQVLGPENVCSLPLQLMGERFLIGQLRDKLVNVATEIATNQPIQTANFKDAVAGGLLMADRKHGAPFSFYPIAKHIFSMNEVPKIQDKSYGFQRRPIVLRFAETFEGATADRHLTAKLTAERDGIFKWMLKGLAMVLDAGDLVVPEAVEADTRDFVKSTNPVLIFVDEECLLGPEYKIKPKDLYQAYLGWIDAGNMKPLSRNNFYNQILMHCPKVVKVRSGPQGSQLRIYKGIGLRVEFGE